MNTPDVVDLIIVLADNKHQLGARYAEWATGAPTLEAATAAAAMAQAELGHARALLPLLRDLSDAASDTIEEDRTPQHFVRLLDRPFASWADFVAANALFDAALTTIVAGMTASSFVPMRGRAKKIVEEERFHMVHGSGWLRRMAQSGGAARLAIEEAIATLWPETLCLFGPDDDRLLHALHHEGVISATSSQLREHFLSQAQRMFEAADMAAPAASPLPWERWNSSSRRLG